MMAKENIQTYLASHTNLRTLAELDTNKEDAMRRKTGCNP